MADKDSSSRLSREEINFADQVRQLREERGWSQDELARRMRTGNLDYVNQTTVSRIENKTRPVRLMEAQMLSMIFGRTIDAMTNPDSRDFWLSIIASTDTSGRRTYVAFKDAVREMAEALVAAEVDVEHLVSLYASDEQMPPDTESTYENLLLNRRNFAQIRMLKEAADIVEAVRRRPADGSPPAH